MNMDLEKEVKIKLLLEGNSYEFEVLAEALSTYLTSGSPSLSFRYDKDSLTNGEIAQQILNFIDNS